ncbi:N-acetylmuramoyl-L-alanine amidase [Thiomicrorhabdus sp.]|uniref:N-acetylmuramoyl-L-alanine amidase n=1 Tax=Thiomicrorhabdus sp. TaxID=2039724 RepID=UPI0029C927A1|nr:N-acetylmuramoyl-L-alanine amidase [Thiomicrorhabdus sp.]
MKSKRYLFKKLSAAVIALGLGCAVSLPAWASSKVASMRIGDNGERLRVVFDVDAPGRYQVKLLDESRLVVNFFDAENGLSFSKKVLGDERLNAVRVQQEKNRLRVILELQENTRYKAFVLPGKPGQNDRVVVDMNRVESIGKDSPAKSSSVKADAGAPVSTASLSGAENSQPKVRNLSDQQRQTLKRNNPAVASVNDTAVAAPDLTSKTDTLRAGLPLAEPVVRRENGALMDQMAQELWAEESVAKAERVESPANESSKADLSQQVDSQRPDSKVPEAQPKTVALVDRKTQPKALVEMQNAAESAVVEPVHYDEVEEQALRDVFANSADSSEFVVAIDAGHGGKDSGAVGANGLHEKQVTLQMAKTLQSELNRYPGIKAILTRDRDVFIPLHERVKIAKQNRADIFVSIHADSFHDRSVQGGSVYILSRGGASSVMARVLAKSENAFLQDVSLKGRDDDVAYALSDLSREANVRASRALATTVLEEMGKKVHMHKASVQSANFAVLKSIDMPSLLIETAFISNPEEAKKLANQNFQIKMASSIAGGLNRFVQTRVRKPSWGETLFVHYRVKEGDTLSSIAANHNLSVKKLREANRSINPRRLYVGTRLLIPLEQQLAKL